MESNRIKIYYFPLRATKPIDIEKLTQVLQTIDRSDEKFSNIIYTINFAKYFDRLYTHIVKYLVIENNNQVNIKILGMSEIKNLNLYKRAIFLPI